jgi:hypothetical protein
MKILLRSLRGWLHNQILRMIFKIWICYNIEIAQFYTLLYCGFWISYFIEWYKLKLSNHHLMMQIDPMVNINRTKSISMIFIMCNKTYMCPHLSSYHSTIYSKLGIIHSYNCYRWLTFNHRSWYVLDFTD